MADETRQGAIDRRRFITAAVATVAVGTGLGAGAGMLVSRPEGPSADADALPTVTPAIVGLSQVAPPVAVDPTADPLAEMARLQAENMRLRADLDAANRRIDTLEASLDGNSRHSETLRAELDSANERMGVMAGLLLLYEQLEKVNVGELLQDGVARVGEAVGELVDDIPTLDEALANGRAALEQFETEIPIVDAGRDWLVKQIERVHAFYLLVEEALRAGVERVGPFLEMVVEWFEDVLRWLPFGMGDTAADIMGAMTNLLAETPFTIAGAQNEVAGPLALWLDPAAGEVPLMTRVVHPLREDVIGRATSTVTKARTVEAAFAERLATPAGDALVSYAALTDAIGRYRANHQL